MENSASAAVADFTLASLKQIENVDPGSGRTDEANLASLAKRRGSQGKDYRRENTTIWSFRGEQRQRETRPAVDPLLERPKSRRLRPREDVLGRVFVGALGPD